MNKIKKFVKKYFENFAYFYRHLHYRIFVAVGLSLAVGILDGFGLVMFLPLLQMVDNTTAEAQSGQMGNFSFLVDAMQYVGLHLNLQTILIVILTFFTLKGVVKFGEGYYKVLLQQRFIRNIRFSNINLFSGFQYKSFVSTDSGRIQNTFSGEVERVLNSYRFYFLAFQQGVLVLVYVLFAVTSNPRFAILVGVGGLLTNLIFNRTNKKTKELSKGLTKDAHTFQGLLVQMVANFKYLKASGLIYGFGIKLKKSITAIEEKQRKIGILGTSLNAMREPMVMLVIVVALLVQVHFFSTNLGLLIVSLMFFHRSLTFLMALQNAWNTFLSVYGSLDNMTEFTEELSKGQEQFGAAKIDQFDQSLVLKDLSFAYGDEPMLKDVDLTIRKNETIAFVGESGSGKTTLMNVLSGLLPVKEGMFLIDGKDSHSVDIRTFQRRIGYITQEPVIFNDTVFNNITFWDEPTPANRARFENALRMAHIYDFVMTMPQKENAVLGNNGITVSGGQKQRISIARELYKEVDLLFMDEATSALDSETENAIQENIDQLRGKYTIILIAHRLSTVRNADRVVLLKNGRVDHEGKFEELKNKSSAFKRMVELQEF